MGRFKAELRHSLDGAGCELTFLGTLFGACHEDFLGDALLSVVRLVAKEAAADLEGVAVAEADLLLALHGGVVEPSGISRRHGAQHCAARVLLDNKLNVHVLDALAVNAHVAFVAAADGVNASVVKRHLGAIGPVLLFEAEARSRQRRFPGAARAHAPYGGGARHEHFWRRVARRGATRAPS